MEFLGVVETIYLLSDETSRILSTLESRIVGANWLILCIIFPVSKSQTMIIFPLSLETTYLPSEDTVTHVTDPPCPSNCRIFLLVWASQISTILPEPVTTYLPSEDMAKPPDHLSCLSS